MGWFTKHTTIFKAGILNGFTDVHSHILPGVDDGIQSIDESLKVLAFLESCGVSSVQFTPHVMEEYPNTSEDLKARFDAFKQEYKGNITLSLAAEYMMDGVFAERLASGDLLTWGENNILVETSYFNPPVNMQQTLYEIKARGYRPVLAHPERYEYMSMGDYQSLFLSGVKLQMNLMSLTGAYGSTAKAKALQLLSKNMYSYKGSDLHSLEGFSHNICDEKIEDKVKNFFFVK